MEYFNVFTDEYISALKMGNNKYLMRLEILADDESSVGDITKNLEAVSGQININYEQITRRSCNLTIANVEDKYLPNKNSDFWFNRKFKMWIGVIAGDNIYWWSQGVFYTKSASYTSGTLNIESVDKGGALDGALKIGMTDVEYVISQGANLSETLRQTLALSVGSSDLAIRGNMRLGGDKPLDVIAPKIHTDFSKQIIQSQVTAANNAYIGELITQIAELYNAEAYYDINGYFVFEPAIDNYGYNYSPTLWSFSDLSASYETPDYEYSFDGENAVCVYTNSSDAGIVNVSYTAYNTNPLSPLNISIGIHRAPDIEIEYYDTSEEQMIKDCRSSANYYLKKHSMLGMQLNFNSPIIPHLDVNKTIEVTDKYADIDEGIFVVQSITIPLSSSAMNISATNINWLPNDMTFDGGES